MGYIRDLAGYVNNEGYVIKPNFLIRSAQLYKITDEQISYLKSIGIKRIIDLRNEQEAIDEPDVGLGPVKYLNISLIDSNLNGATHVKDKRKVLKMIDQLEYMEDTYANMFTNEFSLNNIKRVIREIVLVKEYPTVFHCVTGKDRAGVIAAILLTILGIPHDVVVEDYYKQRKYYMGTARKYFTLIFLFSFNFDRAKKVYDYYAIKKEYIEIAFSTIDANFGSFDNFIHNFIGLTDDEIDEFKKLIMEKK